MVCLSQRPNLLQSQCRCFRFGELDISVSKTTNVAVSFPSSTTSFAWDLHKVALRCHDNLQFQFSFGHGRVFLISCLITPVTLGETHLLQRREVTQFSNFLLQPVQETGDQTLTILALQRKSAFWLFTAETYVTLEG